MPSTFFGLNTSYTGLLAANASLNTTANNISNSETKGYSRQTTVQEAANALRTYTTYGCAGAGVDTKSIDRIRDQFYDDKLRDNSQRKGFSDVKAYYMKSVENYFEESDTINGFNTSFNLMFNALEELQKNAGDKSTRAQFVMYSQSLCDYFNGVSNQLSELQKDMNTEIKDTVAEINSIAERIASLNKQINVIELSGSKANELRDKRDLLLDELSTYVSVETRETPVVDTANNFETGATRFVVTIAGNQTLVDMNDFHSLECVVRENNQCVNQSDAAGLYEIRWVDGADFNIYSNMIGGKLQGLLELRDGNNTENFRGTVTSVDIAAGKVRVDVTLDYLKDLDKCTLSSHGGRISLGAEEYYYNDWTYNYDKTTGECYYEFTIDKTISECNLSSSRIGKEANVGHSIGYQGIPYYQEQLNEFVRLFARTFNEILTSDGAVDNYGNASTDKTESALFRGIGASVDQLSFDDYYTALNAVLGGSTSFVSVSASDNSYYKLTAANLCVNKKMSEDANLLATKTNATDGASKADIVDKLLLIKTDRETLSFRSGNASEFLQSVLSDVALNAGRANSSQKYYTTMGNIIENQRVSISGVDSDEEAVDLVKFKNSYDLSSKMIQTFTEIYDRLILQTGV